MFVAPSDMTHPFSASSEKLPADSRFGRASAAPLISLVDENDLIPEDPIEKGAITRIQTGSDEEAFQQNIPPPLTGLWRLYSDQIARESVQNAQQKHHHLDALVDSAPPSGDLDDKLPVTLNEAKRTPSFTENLPVASQYGQTSTTPLIDDDERDEEQQVHRVNGSVIRNMTGAEENIQHNLPQPLTGLWRIISDKVARERAHHTNQDRRNIPVTTSPSKQAPAILDTTADESDEDDERSIHALSDDRRYQDDEGDLDEARSYSSPVYLFQDTLSADEQREEATEPYLDPDLIRRAHPELVSSLDVPKMVHVSSERSRRDAPQRISIHGHKKRVEKGMVELNPGEFVRIHGKRHAQSAIEKGQSIVVKCSSCKTKFQVDRKAGALYCTHCNSVTKLKKSKKDARLFHSI